MVEIGLNKPSVVVYPRFRSKWRPPQFFGLLRCDRKDLFGEILSSYKKPTVAEVRKNAKHIKGFEDRYYEEYVKES